MKRLFLFVVTAVSMLVAVAQNPDSCFFKKPHFVATASIDFSSPITSEDSYDLSLYTVCGGISLGLDYWVPLKGKAFLQPGVEIYYQTWELNKLAYENQALIDGVYYTNFGVAVPLPVGVRFGFLKNGGLSLFTGPVFRYGLTANEVVSFRRIVSDGSAFKDKTSTSIYGDNGWHRAELGLRFGIAFDIKRWLFGFEWNVGLTTISPKDYDGLKVRSYNGALKVGRAF